MPVKGDKGDAVLTVHFIRGVVSMLVHQQLKVKYFSYKDDWAIKKARFNLVFVALCFFVTRPYSLGVAVYMYL